MTGSGSFNAGTVISTVADLATMLVKAGINEVDIGKVRLHQPVRITLDAYPKVKFEGVIERIAPAARLEEKVKVFDVEIAIDRQGAELRTGMTANIDVVGEKREGVLTVPVEAIFKKDEGDVVYVKKAEEPQKEAKKGGFLSSVLASDGDDEEELDGAGRKLDAAVGAAQLAGLGVEHALAEDHPAARERTRDGGPWCLRGLLPLWP